MLYPGKHQIGKASTKRFFITSLRMEARLGPWKEYKRYKDVRNTIAMTSGVEKVLVHLEAG